MGCELAVLPFVFRDGRNLVDKHGRKAWYLSNETIQMINKFGEHNEAFARFGRALVAR